MLNIRLIYKNQRRKLVCQREQLQYDRLEKKARQLIGLQNKPLLLYYLDEDEQKIVILDNEDLAALFDSVGPNLDIKDIYVKPREGAFGDLGNVHIIKRCCFKELRRKHEKRDRLHRKKLNKDLLSIKKGLLLAKITPSTVQYILKSVSRELEMLFIERMLAEEQNGQHCCPNRDGFSFSITSIGGSKATPSLLSNSDLDFLTCDFQNLQLKKKFSMGPEKIKPESENDWQDMEGELQCLHCNDNLTEGLRFECAICYNYVLCEDCAQEDQHEHPFRPVFVANCRRQKFNFLARVYKKMRHKVMDTTLKLLRDPSWETLN